MKEMSRSDAAEIVALCNIAGRPGDAAGFLASGTSVTQVRSQLQQQQKTPARTAAARPSQLFEPGIGIQIGDRIDLAAIEPVARAAGRLR